MKLLHYILLLFCVVSHGGAFAQVPNTELISKSKKVTPQLVQNKLTKTGENSVKVEVDPGRTADEIPEGQELVNIDFPEETKIKDIIKAVSLWTGKNVIMGRDVNGSVQIISPKKVTKEEAYQAFLSALNMIGLTTVETGRVIKILPVRSAAKSNLKTFLGADYTPLTDEMITQIVPLKYINAQEISRSLSRMASSNAILPYEATNTLIISDSGYKVRRLLSIIKLLDVQGQQPKVAFVPIRHGDAKTIAGQVSKIVGKQTRSKSKRSSSQKFEISHDERSNSVIVFGPPRTIQDVKRLVKKFDLPMDDPSRQASIHVRPLDYADAKKLAATLSSLTGKKSTRRRSPVTRSLGRTSTAKSGETAVAELEDGVKITADESSNSLLITGSRAAYDALNSIIRKLDVRRSQVYVEADILDIGLQGGFKFGSSVFGGEPDNNILSTWEAGGIGSLITAASTTSSTGTPSLSSAAGVVDTFKDDLTVGVLSGVDINVPGLGSITPGILIQMAKSDANVRTISSPQILTANNEEASINVGRRIFLETSTSNPTTGATTKSLEKENVNLELSVKPNISHSNYVTLNTKITQESLGNIIAGNVTINSRKTSQIVTVKNRQTIVISGLVTNEETETFTKIPLLGDIPILGWLFRNSSIENIRSNLVIFMTPHIIHGAQDLAQVYDQKLKDRNKFLEMVYGKGYQQSDFYASLPKKEDGMYKEDQRDQLERTQRMKMLDKLYDSPSAEENTPRIVGSGSEISVPVPVPTDEGGDVPSDSNLTEDEIIELDEIDEEAKKKAEELLEESK